MCLGHRPSIANGRQIFPGRREQVPKNGGGGRLLQRPPPPVFCYGWLLVSVSPMARRRTRTNTPLPRSNRRSAMTVAPVPSYPVWASGAFGLPAGSAGFPDGAVTDDGAGDTPMPVPDSVGAGSGVGVATEPGLGTTISSGSSTGVDVGVGAGDGAGTGDGTGRRGCANVGVGTGIGVGAGVNATAVGVGVAVEWETV